MGIGLAVLAKKHQHFIIGGTIKAATSSLYNSINAHPQVCGSKVKETYFFSRGYSGNIEEDQKKYASFFSPQPGNTVLFEASPNYLTYKENVAPRIKQLFPDIKLLFVLRNPVARLYSHFNFSKSKLELPQEMSFEKFIEYCDCFNNNQITPAEAGISERDLRALEIGNYGKYLKNFYDVFQTENIKVIFFEDLSSNPLQNLEEIAEFIGVAPSFYSDYIMNKTNVTFSARMKWLHYIVLLANRLLEPVLRHRPGLKLKLVNIYKYFNKNHQSFVPMQEDTRKKLREYYAPSNVEVKNILNGQKVPPWVE